MNAKKKKEEEEEDNVEYSQVQDWMDVYLKGKHPEGWKVTSCVQISFHFPSWENNFQICGCRNQKSKAEPEFLLIYNNAKANVNWGNV